MELVFIVFNNIFFIYVLVVDCISCYDIYKKMELYKENEY